MDDTMSQEYGAQGLRAPTHVQNLLAQLHALSLDQEQQLGLGNGGPSINKATDALRSDDARSAQSFDDVMRDKFIALTEDKAMFVYNMVRAKGALTVVEAGTSFGVSTIYLALAVAENARSAGTTRSEAMVIATEHEPSKAAKAREYWRTAGEGVEEYIELREGDILQTLREEVPEVDFVLFDSMLPLIEMMYITLIIAHSMDTDGPPNAQAARTKAPTRRSDHRGQRRLIQGRL